MRDWAQGLPPSSVAVSETHNPNYGGLLFKVRPSQPNSLTLTVGLGVDDAVDFFWGEGYRWENWTATAAEVLEVCEAVQKGNVCEEMWLIGSWVLERRCYIDAPSGRSGDGSLPMPRWLKRWARLSIRRMNRGRPKVVTEANGILASTPSGVVRSQELLNLVVETVVVYVAVPFIVLGIFGLGVVPRPNSAMTGQTLFDVSCRQSRRTRRKTKDGDHLTPGRFNPKEHVA